jgi:hypothetical protein
LENDVRAIYKAFEKKMKDIGREFKIFQNVGICTLGTEVQTSLFLEILQKHFESIGKRCKGHLYTI